MPPVKQTVMDPTNLPTKNIAAVLHGIKDMRVEEVPMPAEPEKGMVTVQMKNVGIGGSDVH